MMLKIRLILLCLLSLYTLSACADDSPPPVDHNGPDTTGTIPTYTFRIVKEYPHDSGAYTQGLVYHNGFLYEGTGLNRFSTLRKVVLETGEVVQSISLPYQYFGEGIAIVGGLIIQITWLNQMGFVYDLESFAPVDTFQYAGEGWGLTYDGTHLIMSDGSSRLRFLDKGTYAEAWSIFVHDKNGEVTRLNELEFIGGRVYANVYMTDLIAIIDPGSGTVRGWIDCTGLREAGGITGSVDVLNGIAYDPAGKRLFVTGKLWPKLFEIELVGGGADSAGAGAPAR